MKARDLMDIVEEENIHEDEMDMGRLSEMVDRMDVDHVLALLAHVCVDKAEEADEEGNHELSNAWSHDATVIQDAANKVG